MHFPTGANFLVGGVWDTGMTLGTPLTPNIY
jgi:hypothetical protein